MSYETIYGQMFSDNVLPTAQQKVSKLRSKVLIKSNVVGEVFYQDQLGSWTMTPKTARNAATPATDPQLLRRMGIMEDFNDGKLFDTEDELKTISDPKSPFNVNAQMAIGREYDDLIIGRLVGNANSGKAGGDVNTITQEVAVSTTNLTIDKVLEAKSYLDDADCGDERCLVVSPAGHNALLEEAKATSKDYMMAGLVDGSIARFLGFDVVMSTRLLGAAATKQCIAFERTGFCLGEAASPRVRVTEDHTHCYAWQLYYEVHIGGVRLEEEKVVPIYILETA
jgi:hypothetical protein